MGVWRRKNSAQPTSESLSKPWGDVAKSAPNAAMALAREINLLLGVANDSSDFRTKSVRLASAKQKLSELQDLVSLHPRMSITGLSEAQAGIARVEGDLLALRYQPEGDGAIWVFHAALFLKTPLDELHCHGLVEQGAFSDLPRIASLGSCSGWKLIAPSLREIGVDIDEPPQVVASDIGPLPAHGEPYLSFLMIFRSLIESGMAPIEIELGLNIFSGRDEFTEAVFERLGPAKLMMRRAGMIRVR